MAETFPLEAQPRQLIGKKVGQLRRSGLVPVCVYGPKNQPLNLQIPARSLQSTLLRAGGTHLIELQHEGKVTTVLAREVQRDVLRGDILHVDFFAVDLTAKIIVDVPVQFVNESPAVLAKLGILLTGPSTLRVETLPSKLQEKVIIDLSVLKQLGDTIHVSDLNLGEGITIVNDPDELVAGVRQSSAARSEADEAAEAEASAEVEIIKKGKTDEEEEA